MATLSRGFTKRSLISEEEIDESEEVSPGVITGLRQGWKSSEHRNIGSERLPAKGIG